MKIPNAHALNCDGLRRSLRRLIIFLPVVMFCVGQRMDAAEQYWRTDGASGGTWTSTNWSNPASATGGTAWGSGNDAFFTAGSTLTFVTSTLFRNVTLSDGIAVTITAAGTASAGAHIYDIRTGSSLTWQSQNFTANGTSFTKNGQGTWNIGAIGNAYSGGFTLNAGTVIVTGTNSLGAGSLSINGGTIQSSGSTAFAPTSITVGGDFALSGTGDDTWNGNVDIGSATRTITNGTSSNATRTFTGTISGAAGLTFEGGGGSGAVVLSGSNNYLGVTTVNEGVVKLDGGTTADPILKNTGGVVLTTGGTLLFSGAGDTNNKLHTAATVTLGGGTLNTGGLNGLDQTVGALTLTASSVIDFAALVSGSQTLRFAASNADWTGRTLSIWNWTAGIDHLFFGTSASGLDASQLAQVSFYGGSGTGFLGTGAIASDGQLSAIPEPSTVGALVALAGLICWRERRRLRGMMLACGPTQWEAAPEMNRLPS